jgi:putrescine aminotransferase
VPAPAGLDQVLDRYARHVNKSLASLARLVATPVEVAAAGSKVQGSDGHAYLDCGGFGVFLLGHCHPVVVATVREQLARNPIATRLFLNPELAQAAADLAGITPAGLDYVFLTNSGAEATELGLKLARLAGKPHVIAMHGGFHGKTLGALSVTGRPQYRDPFEPLLPLVDFVPFGDLAALQAVLTGQSAVLLEPVQAEGGVRLPPGGYLAQVRQACTAAGAVLILDEIQSGMGRLGAWWGSDLADVTPDVLLAGKILGGGVMPVGAVVASAQLFAPLNADPLLHSSTFAGSPLAAAAVTATIAVIKSEGLIERARDLGPQIRDLAAAALTAHCPHLVTEVRGQGLLIGIDFVLAEAATEFLIGLLDQHVIPSYSLNASNVLRLTPPAILDAADLDWLARALTCAARHVSRILPSTAPHNCLPEGRPTCAPSASGSTCRTSPPARYTPRSPISAGTRNSARPSAASRSPRCPSTSPSRPGKSPSGPGCCAGPNRTPSTPLRLASPSTSSTATSPSSTAPGSASMRSRAVRSSSPPGSTWASPAWPMRWNRSRYGR